MNCYLGFDGGGTKTECIVLDAEDRVLGQGKAGPSNPLRVGYDAACAALQMAAAMALSAARVGTRDIQCVCAGLAGAGRKFVAEEMRSRLARIWSNAHVEVVTDADAALETAVGQQAGVILIAGTGSIALGRNLKGEIARAGGYGHRIGDVGSAYDIGRHAVLAVARARDFSGPATVLADLILGPLDCRRWDDVFEKVSSKPGATFPKLVPAVMQAAAANDAAAREILSRASVELAGLALTVIGRLDMRGASFRLARVGGVFGHSSLLDGRVGDLIQRVAPGAALDMLEQPPALGAARIALRNSQKLGAQHGRFS